MATEIISKTKTVSVTKALASAAAYTAGDVLCENATTGTAWTFAALFRGNNTGGYISQITVTCETNAVTPRLTLNYYNATPTCELRDNVASTQVVHADIAKHQGSSTLAAMKSVGSGDSTVTASPNTPGGLPLWVNPATSADDLIVIVTTEDGFTNTATNDLTIDITMVY